MFQNLLLPWSWGSSSSTWWWDCCSCHCSHGGTGAAVLAADWVHGTAGFLVVVAEGKAATAVARIVGDPQLSSLPSEGGQFAVRQSFAVSVTRTVLWQCAAHHSSPSLMGRRQALSDWVYWHGSPRGGGSKAVAFYCLLGGEQDIADLWLCSNWGAVIMYTTFIMLYFCSSKCWGTAQEACFLPQWV